MRPALELGLVAMRGGGGEASVESYMKNILWRIGREKKDKGGEEEE